MTDRFASRMFTRSLGASMQKQPAFGAFPQGPPESKVVGLDPVRALVIGSGVAVGFGVHDHDEALTGHLARAMAVRSGRGAIVHNRAGAKLSLDQAIEQLGQIGAHTYRSVVWCPSMFEVIGSPTSGRLGRAIRHAVPFLRDTAGDRVEIVLTGLPLPSSPGSLEQVARRIVPRFNRALALVCNEFAAQGADVRFVAPPYFTSLRHPDAFQSSYYLRFAQTIAVADADGIRSA